MKVLVNIAHGDKVVRIEQEYDVLHLVLKKNENSFATGILVDDELLRQVAKAIEMYFEEPL